MLRDNTPTRRTRGTDKPYLPNRRELRPGIALTRNAVSWEPRDQRAISIASRTIVVRTCEATRHPTIVREKASMMKQT
jgi:hypothetical protein